MGTKKVGNSGFGTKILKSPDTVSVVGYSMLSCSGFVSTGFNLRTPDPGIIDWYNSNQKITITLLLGSY